MESFSLLAFILLLTSFSLLVDGYSSVRSHIAKASRERSVGRLSAASLSLKPQITKLIARQDLTTAETEVGAEYYFIRFCSNWSILLLPLADDPNHD